MTTPTLTCSVRTEPGATDQPMRITGTQNTRSDEQLSEFENYLENRKRMAGASLSVIEEVGTKAALNSVAPLRSESSATSAIRSLNTLLTSGCWPTSRWRLSTLRPCSATSRAGRSRDEIAEIIGVTTGALQTCSKLGVCLRRSIFNVGTGLLPRQPA